MSMLKARAAAVPSAGLWFCLCACLGWLAVMTGPVHATDSGPALERRIGWLSGSDQPVAGGDHDRNRKSHMQVGVDTIVADWLDRPDLVAEPEFRSGSGAAAGIDAIPVRRYQQRLGGLPVFGSRVNVLFGSDGAPRALSGAVSRHRQAPAGGGFRLTDTDALRAAVADRLAVDAEAMTFTADGRIGTFSAYTIDAGPDIRVDSPLRVRALWYPAEDRLIAAWQVELAGSRPVIGMPGAWSVLVSAEDGRILRADTLIRDLRVNNRLLPSCSPCPPAGFAYRVMASRRGVPYVDPYGFTAPHPTGQADGFVPDTQAPSHLLRLRHSGISTGDPWLPDDATHTVGNNVDAFFKAVAVGDGVYLDPFADWDNWTMDFSPEAGDFRAPVTAPGVFDYSYDVALAPADYFEYPGAPAAPIPVDSPQLNAKIVQAFYTANWLHDLFYDLGFDEAAGNLQQDNYGRGGVGGDPLIVHVGHWVTFASVRADGVSPSITLGLNPFSVSSRDISGFDFSVFVHEWAHTMLDRLVDMRYTGQQGAIHEGSADFLGMFLMVQAQHRRAAPATAAFHGAYPVGAYGNLDYWWPMSDQPPAGSPGVPDNTYWHGIRRFPYSASFDINPLTFGHLSPEQPIPDGFEPFDWKGRGPIRHEIHTAGEIWASALWQCARNILAASNDRGFAIRHRQFLADVVAALKLLPTDATFTEARDAMLLAVRARDQDDYLRCRAGFAERGLGAEAVSPPRDAIEFHDVIESFVDADPPALGVSR